MENEIINLDNEVIDTVSLQESIFALPLRVDILNLVVKWQRARKQSGNHKTRLINEISGTTKKPWKQKGTGRARVGSLRVPHFRGGATMFGPRVRSHSFDLPKKIRSLGLKIALSSKKFEKELYIVDNLFMDSYRTKFLFDKISKISKGKILIVDDFNKKNEKFMLAAANLPKLDVISEQGINVYDILCHDSLVLTKNAFICIERKLI